MISLHNILSIAKYERKTLLRSWFFRIFSILSLIVLFGLNFGMVIEGGGGEGWMIKAIPSAIPYFNLLILNVAQAIIAVFLASDFLKRDKKLDTTEVIYMRSMTNSEYVIGKTWGNLQVFLVLNVVVVILALVFNMLAEGTSIDWISYGIYILLISVPTLIFIMGLSFLLMSVIRNQAITFVLILGYIGITLFLLQAKFYYIFDYMAFNIPMLNSNIAGFGNLDVVLAHRGIYFCLGAGFIFLSIFLLKRLPQSESSTFLSLVFAILFIAAGGYLGFNHINRFKQDARLREKVVELNNQYVKEKVPATIDHAIDLVHQGDSISATSKLLLRNDSDEPLHKLIFSLNDGLKISWLAVGGKEVPFTREYHLVMVTDNVSLLPGAETTVEISYSGKINEKLCYLDIDEETMQDKYGKFVINVDKRFAFITPSYVLLTPEANWYPRLGVTYSSTDVSWNQTQFINFNLNVKTSAGLKAVSQGKINTISDGQFSFQNEHPMPQLSLAIGNYQYKNMVENGIEFGIWYIGGHDFFSGAFPEIKDTIPSIIKEQLADFERKYNLEYVFERIALVETPAQFKTFERSWTSCQEYVQPEQILIPEKGFMIRAADFEGSKKRMQRWGNHGGEMTPVDMQTRVLGEFLRTFTQEQETNFRGGPGGMTATDALNPYFIFPMFYNFQNNIQSDKWPITNRVFEAYLKNQETDMRSVFMRDMSGLSEDEMANIALQDSTFEEILADKNQKKIIDNVIKLKGDVLFSMIQYRAGEVEFKNFLQKILNQYKFENISFEDFDQHLKQEFDMELIPVMDDWFKAKTLPGFLISPITAVKVKSGEMMKTKISLKTTNFSDTEGLIKITFRLGGFGGGGPGRGSGMGGGGSQDLINKLIFLEPHQTKEISYLLDAEPRMIMVNTKTSKNIPQVVTQGFREIAEDLKASATEGETISDTPVLTALPNETVVDNEDPRFEITSNNKQSLLERWILKENEGGSRYAGMNNWRPPTSWTAITNTDFYGQYIRSGYYIKSGDGSQVAKWHVPVSKPGYYDVYYHLYKSRGFRRGSGGGGNEEKGKYTFTIHADDGPEVQELDVQSSETGWNHLGSFYFSSDTALVELSNKSELRMVFADAVKIVEL